MKPKHISPKTWNATYPIGTHVRYTNATLGVVIETRTMSAARYHPDLKDVCVALQYAPVNGRLFNGLYPLVRICMLEVFKLCSNCGNAYMADSDQCGKCSEERSANREFNQKR